MEAHSRHSSNFRINLNFIRLFVIMITCTQARTIAIQVDAYLGLTITVEEVKLKNKIKRWAIAYLYHLLAGYFDLAVIINDRYSWAIR
ncbi:hypothetical protein B0O99DRAFT_614250 [Bisporella sp. PMI_857]|nr:hypothetical protein B0O99DRAFT_614250 [Bisporella sp. PMI_857]